MNLYIAIVLQKFSTASTSQEKIKIPEGKGKQR